MLTINDLSITCRRDLRTIVSHLSLNLGPGERCAVVGEEGNGKSTLLKLLYDPGLVEPYAEYTGSFSFGRDRSGYLSQEVSAEELKMPAADYLRSDAAFRELNGRERALLERMLGLPQGISGAVRPLKSFSGGERVKLRLARVLAAEPDVLLLDEPTNDLDLGTLEWLEDFLSGCEKAVLFVSHDEALLERCSTMVLHLELLRRKTMPRSTVSRLPYGEYVAARSRALERQEQTARKEREEFNAQMERFRRIRQKVEHDQAALTRQDPHSGRLLKKKMHAVQSMGRRFEREREKLTALPEIEEPVFLSFPETASVPRGKRVLGFELPELAAGGRVLARDVRLELFGPEKICIAGPNGAGKTTLLRLIASALAERRDIRAAYMPQDYADTVDLSKTPVELLNRSGDRAEEERVRELLGSLRYTTDEMSRPASGLSGGQRAKLLLASLALSGANVLILDEPTRNLSPLSGPALRRALRAFPGAIISVSHDRKFIFEVCTRAVLLTPDGLVPLTYAQAQNR